MTEIENNKTKFTGFLLDNESIKILDNLARIQKTNSSAAMRMLLTIYGPEMERDIRAKIGGEATA